MHRLSDLKDLDLADRRGATPVATGRLKRLAGALGARGVGGDDPIRIFFVPGRIEVLGKHTDYAGGRSLVTATEQGIWMVATPRTDRQIRLTDLGRGQTLELALDVMGKTAAWGWALYPQTVARRMMIDLDSRLQGAEIAFESDLPSAAGLSSSSALVIATYMALAASNDLDRPPRLRQEIATRESLAAYLGAVEAGRDFLAFGEGGPGVGTMGGNGDHTAILCSQPGEIRQYSYLPTRLERILQLPAGLRFAVAVSGVSASKTGEAKDDYNRASRLVAQLTEIWNRRTGRDDVSLADALNSDPLAVEELEGYLRNEDPQTPRDALLDRLRHFAVESGQLVPGASEALAQGDCREFGEVVDRSQELATSLLGNQIEETVWLSAAARELGALAASAFGAGFGGSVWALVSQQEMDSFLRQWSERYAQRFPNRMADSIFFSTGAGGPVAEL